MGVREVIYIGECLSLTTAHKLRDAILADGADAGLLRRARNASRRFSLPVTVCGVTTNDRFYLGESTGSSVVDFATAAVYDYAREHGLAALSILTVSENTATCERVDEHERQGRFNAASRLAFETLT